MAESQTPDPKEKRKTKRKRGLSPQLPWELPEYDDDQFADQKGRVNRNLRQREQAERQKSY